MYIHTGLSTAAIIGIVTGCLLILGIVIIIFATLFGIYKRKKRKNNMAAPILIHTK